MTGGTNLPHTTVFLKEAVEQLRPRSGGRYIDGTLGAGGHTKALFEQCDGIEVMGIDRDQEALEAARSRLQDYEARCHLVRGTFSNMAAYADDLNWKTVDGILLDVGVSSMQLDRPERGFSYRFDGPLDMRMDRRHKVTASRLLNESTLGELEQIFRKFGEEPASRRIAKAIVKQREDRPFSRTIELSELLQRVVPPRGKRRNTEGRCFQALRIAVNDELGELNRALETAVKLLAPGGRLAVISFHSLEDRPVKQFFVAEAKDCVCPPDFPVCRCDTTPRLKVITRKPICASAEECAANKRASSAKLRVAERL